MCFKPDLFRSAMLVFRCLKYELDMPKSSPSTCQHPGPKRWHRMAWWQHCFGCWQFRNQTWLTGKKWCFKKGNYREVYRYCSYNSGINKSWEYQLIWRHFHNRLDWSNFSCCHFLTGPWEWIGVIMRMMNWNLRAPLIFSTRVKELHPRGSLVMVDQYLQRCWCWKFFKYCVYVYRVNIHII